MMSELGRRHMISTNKESSFEDEDEIGLLLREQPHDDYYDREEELNIYRSGSAPPTVEGSLNAVGGLLGYGGGGGSGFQEFARKKSGNGFASEDELMSDPDYLSYYYLNVNLNPRLPPPLLSKEDWRSAKRLQGGSSAVGSDRRMVNRSDSSGSGSRSMLSMPPGFSSKRQEIDIGSEQVQGGSLEWSGDGLIGLGSKQKSFAETFQDDSGQTMFISKAPSRPISRNALDRTMDNLGSVEADLANLRSGSSAQLGGQPVSYSYAAALSRSTTPDPQAIVRAPSPGLPPIGGGRSSNAERRNITSPNPSNNSGFLNDSTTEVAAALSSMSLGNNVLQEENRFPSRIGQEFEENYLFNLQNNSNQQHSYLKSDSGPSGSKKVSSASSMLNNGGGGLQSQYHHLDSPISGYNNLNNYPVNQLNLPPLFENAAAASAMGLPGMDPRMLGAFSGMNPLLTDQNRRFGNPMTASGLQSPYMDQAYPQYLNTDYLASFNDPSADQAYINLLQKVYIEGMLSPHNKVNHPGFYNNRAFGLSYPQSPLASPSVHNGPVSPMRHSGDLNLRYPSGMRNVGGGGGGGGGGGVLGPWHLDGHLDNLDKNFSSTLLEEFKVNKTMCVDLSEIAGHVVEFSADQYGSRFIQQKLENATIEEKDMVFSEISPHALILMTDVFGNYVIQKFFEHGLASQRRELARKLSGKVLSMSLQMYGCRVIQKAIEVVDEDQKIQMVKELDGQVVRCVHDQNGNHVIQKCIECIPEEHIHFIVSTFFGQVVTLSTHSYGCRVIQRVLEHCINPETQSKVMEEILRSVSMLAQDQYGNYVIQHILQHGKPDERSTIIRELAGKIVLMSQQKFASNVVEKCLTYGDSNEVQLLVNEMLGTTDENEPLQAMMKDQFANYVVQKVLETCSDQQRELIMSRIKVHLNALKKYTFGKHIVTRVEKLLATGERKTAESQSMNRAY